MIALLRTWRARLIDPFLVTATILLIVEHWDHFDIGDIVLLALIALDFALRLPGRLSAGRANRRFAPQADR